MVANPDNKILCWCQTKKIGTVWSKLTKEKRREYVPVSLAQIFLKACIAIKIIIRVAGKAEISECLQKTKKEVWHLKQY